MSSISRGSKTRPSLRHLNTGRVALLRKATKTACSGLQATVVVVAEARFLHEIEHGLCVIFHSMQRKFAIISREGRSRVLVPRLSDRARIAVGLSAARVDRLNMRVTRREAIAGDLVEIGCRPFEIFVDRVGPSAMHDAQTLD